MLWCMSKKQLIIIFKTYVNKNIRKTQLVHKLNTFTE